MTSNSPLKRASLLGSILYLSILSKSRLTPGTVSTRPSNEAEIWNSLNRQAATQPVVALERPTWSLMITGVLMLVPIRVLTRMSKSVSRGAAELQTGILMWTSPGNLAFKPSITLLRVTSSLTSTSFSALLMSTNLSLPSFSFAAFNNLDEFFFISFSRITGDISKLSILSDLVWWTGTDGLTVNIDIWFLAEVEPDDLSVLGVVGSSDLL